MELRELRDFAKRMGGEVPVVAEEQDVDGMPLRADIVGLRAERTQAGETLVLVIGGKGGSDA